MVDTSETLIALENVRQFFTPNPCRHGRMTEYDPESGKKLSTTQSDGPVTDLLLERHLTQDPQTHVGRLGWLAGGLQGTQVGCFDIDRRAYPEVGSERYEAVLERMKAVLREAELPFYHEVSTNKGAHLWLFTDAELPYETMVNALKALRDQSGIKTIETYPTGNSGAEGKWLYMPYSAALSVGDGLGRTYLLDALDAPIPVWELSDKVKRCPGARLQALAAQHESQSQRAKAQHKAAPYQTYDLHPLALDMLKELSLKPPNGLNRHESLMTFLNLGKRTEALEAMRDHLASEEVWSVWVTDGSRTAQAWADEVERLHDMVRHAEAEQHEYGIQHLKNLGWAVPRLPKRGGDGALSLSSVSAGELAELYRQELSKTGEHYTYHTHTKTFYRYDAGVYVPLEADTFLTQLERWCNALGTYPSNNKLREAADKLGRVHLSGEPGDFSPCEEERINCTNGLYNVETGQLEPHSPEHITVTQLGAAYNPALRGQRGRFHAFIEQIVPEPQHRKILQEYLGYSLTARTGIQKFLDLHGKPRSGKGTLWRIFLRVVQPQRREVGSMALEGFSFEQLANPASLSTLMHKHVVSIGEVATRSSPARSAIITLKTIVGEDALTVNPKYLPAFSHKFTCKFVLMSNVGLFLGDDASNSSIYDRRLTIPFLRTIPAAERNPNLEQEIVGDALERDLTLLWLLEGLERVRDNGWRLSDDLSANNQELQEQANPMIEFVRQQLEVLPSMNPEKDWIRTEALVLRHAQWLQRNGYHERNNVNLHTLKSKLSYALEALGHTDPEIGWHKLRAGAVYRRLRWLEPS